MNIFAMSEEVKPSEKVLNSASFGQLEALVAALDAGGDPNYVRLDIAPSLIATMRDYVPCLEVLLQRGARGDIPNRVGWTALHEAAQKEAPECLQLLLAAPEQTSFHQRDKEGLTALRAAMEANRMENANVLLQVAPDLLNITDNKGFTPAMWAASEKSAQWLEWCLARRADMTYINERGQSAQSLINEWDEGKQLLAQYGTQQPLSSVSSVAPAQQVQADSTENAAPVPSNPFGLGAVKKKTLS